MKAVVKVRKLVVLVLAVAILLVGVSSLSAQPLRTAEVRIASVPADDAYRLWLGLWLGSELLATPEANSTFLSMNPLDAAKCDHWADGSGLVVLRPGANTLCCPVTSIAGQDRFGSGTAAAEDPRVWVAAVFSHDGMVEVTEASWMRGRRGSATHIDRSSGSGVQWVWSEPYRLPPGGQPADLWLKITITTAPEAPPQDPQ